MLWERLIDDGEPVPPDDLSPLLRAVSDTELDAAVATGRFVSPTGGALFVTRDPDRLSGGAYGGKDGGHIIEFADLPTSEENSHYVRGLAEETIDRAGLDSVRRVWSWDPARGDHLLTFDATLPDTHPDGSWLDRRHPSTGTPDGTPDLGP